MLLSVGEDRRSPQPAQASTAARKATVLCASTACHSEMRAGLGPEVCLLNRDAPFNACQLVWTPRFCTRNASLHLLA